MTTPKTVYCVVGDIGGVKEVLPIARELEKRGVTVKWFLDSSPKAKAGDMLAKVGIKPEMKAEGVEGNPDLILVGTSATANAAQVDWTRWGRINGFPVIWMEDLHGTGSRKNSLGVSPDLMLVIDEMAAKIATAVRPGLRTVVVGKPSFSDSKEMPRLEDGPAIRAKMRGELGLKEHVYIHDDPSKSNYLVVVGFGGDPAERAEAQLDVLLSDADQLFSFRNSVVAWRFHPKHPKANEMYERAVAAMTAMGIRTVDARKMDMNHLTIAADFCIADWGNTNQLAAALHGTPVATMMFPHDPRLVETYPPDGFPPVVVTDRSWGVENNLHLRHWSVACGYNGAYYRQYTREVRGKVFRPLLEPGAAERAVEVVMNEMGRRESEEPECGNCGCGHG